MEIVERCLAEPTKQFCTERPVFCDRLKILPGRRGSHRVNLFDVLKGDLNREILLSVSIKVWRCTECEIFCQNGRKWQDFFAACNL